MSSLNQSSSRRPWCQVHFNAGPFTLSMNADEYRRLVSIVNSTRAAHCQQGREPNRHIEGDETNVQQ
jgi:hypothetical protein